VAEGGQVAFNTTPRYDIGHDIHIQSPEAGHQDLWEMRFDLPQPPTNRGQSAALGEPTLLPQLFSLGFTQHPQIVRCRYHRPQPHLSLLWEEVPVHGQTRQQRAPKVGVQRLSFSTGGTATQSQSDHLQRWGLRSLRLRQMPRRLVFSPPRPCRQARLHLSHDGVGVGASPPRVGQVRSAVPQLPCRDPLGGMA
jgi:hypothetical protein